MWFTQALPQPPALCKLGVADARDSHAYFVVLQVADAMKAQGHV